MEGWTPVPATRRMRFGAAASPPPVVPLRLTAAVPSRGANCAGKRERRQKSAAQASAGKESAWSGGNI